MQTIVSHKHWYAIQPFYRRYAEIQRVLDSEGVGYIHPYRFNIVKGKNVETETDSKGHSYGIYGLNLSPVMAVQLLFVYASRQELESVRQTVYERGRVLSTTRNGLWEPLVIPGDQLLEFLKVLSLDADYTMIDDRPDVFSKGEPVRVVAGGMYDGLEGVVCRIKHNRHLIVRIEGVCAVATDYIPQAYLVKKSDPAYGRDLPVLPSMKVAELSYNLRLLVGLARENAAYAPLVSSVHSVLTQVSALIDGIKHLDLRLDTTRAAIDSLLSEFAPTPDALPADDALLPDICTRTLTLCDEIHSHFPAAH